MTGIFTAKLLAGSYPAIRAELSRSIIADIDRDPLGEKIILAPSNHIVGDLYDEIARKREKPIFNLHAMTLLDFARRLLKHRQLPFIEIDSMTRAVLLAEVVQTCCQKMGPTGSFWKVFDKKGFVSSLLRLFDEFEEGMISGKEAESLGKKAEFLRYFKDPNKIKELFSLYRAFLRGVEKAGLKTRTHIVRLASEGFEVPGYPFRVRIFGFYDFTRIQWFLVEKLLSSGLIEEVFFPLPMQPSKTGSIIIEDPADLDSFLPEGFRYARYTLWQFLRQFDGNVTILDDTPFSSKSMRSVRKRLFHRDFSGNRKELPFRLISAPHGPGELRCVARLIKDDWEKKGRPNRKIGLIYRQVDETVAADMERVLDEFRIPHAIAQARPLVQTAPVRTLLGLLKLPFKEYPRRETIDTLTSPCFDIGRLHTGADVHSPLWDHLSKKTGIMREGDWEEKLNTFIEKSNKHLKSHAEEHFEEGDETSRGAGGTSFIKREIESARVLVRCFKVARRSLAELKRCDSYSRLADTITVLLNQFIRVTGQEAHVQFSFRVLRRATRVLKSFGELTWRTIPFENPYNAILLLEKIFQEERLPRHHLRSPRDGFFVVAGDIATLRGMTFDDIYMMGLNEGAWPLTRKDVSLLKEDEREIFLKMLGEPGLPPPLSRIRDNIPEETLLFTLPFIMCDTVKAISFQRSDMDGTSRVPSPLLTDLVFSFRGPEIFYRGLDGSTVGENMIEFPRQLRERFRAPGKPSEREFLISWLMKIPQGMGETEPLLPRSSRAIIERATGTLYQWLGGRELAPDPKKIALPAIPKGKLNHTFLDNYIHCPYKTYLRYGLNLEPLPEPEEVFSIGRMEMGLIAHRSLYHLYRDGKPDTAPAPVERAVKRSIEEYGRDHPLGLRGLREISARSLGKTIHDYLAWEKENLTDVSHALVEITFGLKDGPDIAVEVAGEQIPISGKIDRIDRKGDAIWVLDYKLSAGAKYVPLEDKISCGILNQIPLYGIAAKEMLADRGIDVQAVTGGYVALKRDRKKGHFILARIDWEGPLFARWKESLRLLLYGLQSRLFPPLSDRYFKVSRWKAHYCEYCDFADICRVSPMTTGNEMIARNLADSFHEGYPALTWHRMHREPF